MKINKKVLTYELPIIAEPQKDGGFVVRSENWEDCYAQGDTLQEAILEITGVAQSLIELYQEEGLEIPLRKKQENTLGNLLFNVPIIVTA